ncbi:GTPase [Occultella aeris]|uniref:tRNA modification GTPase TrmE n=1 Tax=Occultella aeris TaxID=2761496 RepID=A0A7M4DSV1_9MICO|nr:GTPase [Occultella aeris]VZO40545.1 tRNA modification GTPase TrmE [Occultella aeris]
MARVTARARVGERADLGPRLAGLRDAVEVLDRVGAETLADPAHGRHSVTGPHRTEPPEQAAPLARAHGVLTRVGRRRELSAEHTVVALAGATGSGKSSVINALSGTDVATVGARRPTTSHPLAIIWGAAAPAGELLDWLEVTQRVEVAPDHGGTDLSGLVLLDLPDIDSVQTEHHLRAARLAEAVDVLVWVLDPQKYADAVVHTQYLRPMSRHAEVTVAVLNQADLLAPGDRAPVLADLTDRLADDGLRGARVLAVSARTGEGLDDLREVIARFVSERRAADARLSADIATVAAELGTAYTAEAGSELGAPDRRRLVSTLARSAGVEEVADAVAGSFRHRARASTGWPVTRWLGRFRRDPLRRLHLDSVPERGEGGAVVATSSIPAASPVQRAKVATALRDLGDATAAGSAEPWRSYMRSGATGALEALPDALDQAIVSTPLVGRSDPRWFGVVGALQWLVFAILAAGVLWLGVLAALRYFGLPVTWLPQLGPVPADPPWPQLPALPWPTVLVIVGVVLGLLISLISAVVARVGARRRARKARADLNRAVADVAERLVLDPVRARIADVAAFAAGIRTAGG